MIRKIIPVFTATAISMSISFIIPVAITTVSSVAFAPEAQAFGLGSIKKAAKKTKRVVKRKAKNAKDIITCKTCPGGRWIDPTALGEFAGKVRRAPGKYTKRAGKAFIRDTRGAGQIALGTAKAAGRTIDRRTSQACVALGSCQGTITGGVSQGTKITGRRR